ncbi:MAG: EamA family transporter [Rhodobacterales bacterium 32-67-9]|nr:MAG: EamA family transporter [Rhodobacterales bacterium 32-67-9]
MPHPTLRNWLSIGALGLIWGATFMVIALALRGYGPVTVATARTTLGAVTLCVAVVALGRPLPVWSALLGAHILVIGLFSTAIPFFLLSWGQQSVASAFAGLSMAAVPLFVLPLAHVFVPGEQLNWRKMAGFLLGFLGVLVLTGPDALAGSAATLPRLACLGAALCYAVSSIATRRCPPVDPVMLAALSLIVGAGALIPAMAVSEGLPRPVGAIPMAAIIVLGLVPTALATLIRVQVIRSAGPSFMTLTNYQVPLWSVLFGTLVLDETLSPRFFVALGLILAGLALSRKRR